MKAIYFDMDGTIANLYGVSGWLEDLRNEKVRPYKEADTMVRMATLARLLHKLQNNGYSIGIVSWLCRGGNQKYNEAVTAEKIKWLKLHLPSVEFNEVHIVEYGTPKEKVVKYPQGILFDDEERNRKNWIGKSFSEKNLLENLRGLL